MLIPAKNQTGKIEAWYRFRIDVQKFQGWPKSFEDSELVLP